MRERSLSAEHLPAMIASGLARKEGDRTIDLTVRAGECVVITGRSGSGKTSLLKLLADLSPGIGDVRIGQTDREAVPGSAWRRKVMYLATDAGWWTSPVSAHMSDLPAARELMVDLELSQALLQASPDEISSGERQRLSLVRALILCPMFLLLDEPTSALDQTSARLVEKVIQRSKANGTGFVITSHDREQVKRLADRHLDLGESGFVEIPT